ncbi:MAG: hypothetical protein Q8R83_05630 [Legionellaceae bacterium]|nr:hypothetical protein [Legionellaceae bacterium]
MNHNIKQAILNTFKINSGVSEGIIIERLKAIPGLSNLYIMLDNPSIPPKIVMGELEEIVLRIKLTEHPNKLESMLLQQLKSLVYNSSPDSAPSTYQYR